MTADELREAVARELAARDWPSSVRAKALAAGDVGMLQLNWREWLNDADAAIAIVLGAAEACARDEQASNTGFPDEDAYYSCERIAAAIIALGGK